MISGLKSTIGSSISGKRCEVMEVVEISGLKVGLGNGGGVKVFTSIVFIVDDLVATEVVVGVMVVEKVDRGGVIEVVEEVLVEGFMIGSGLQS